MAKRQRVQAVGSVSSKSSPPEAGNTRRSVISELHQQGSARIRFPSNPPGPLQAVMLNTAGGLTGDDDIEWNVHATGQSHLVTTTAACEKIYRTHGPAAKQRTNARVDSGATLFWLPQETIFFDGSALHRTLHADIEESGKALFVESLILGREAMSENIQTIDISDRWRISRNGKLLHAEDFRLSSMQLRYAQNQSALHHYRAMSTLVFVSDQSPEALTYQLESVRSLAKSISTEVTVAASVLKHRLVIRMLALNSFYLRKFLLPCIEKLSDGAPIPKVWNV